MKKIESALKNFSHEQKLTDDEQYRVLVATTEAVHNAIVHGNKMDIRKQVLLTCFSNKNSITIRVRDYGSGFDPDALPDPTLKENLFKEHGRGVYLIRALMDEVRFKKLKEGIVIEMVLRKKRRVKSST